MEDRRRRRNQSDYDDEYDDRYNNRYHHRYEEDSYDEDDYGDDSYDDDSYDEDDYDNASYNINNGRKHYEEDSEYDSYVERPAGSRRSRSSSENYRRSDAEASQRSSSRNGTVSRRSADDSYSSGTGSRRSAERTGSSASGRTRSTNSDRSSAPEAGRTRSTGSGRSSAPEAGRTRSTGSGRSSAPEADRTRSTNSGRSSAPEAGRRRRQDSYAPAPVRENPPRRRKKKKKHIFLHFICTLFVLCIICGVVGVIGGAKLFEKETGETVKQCIEEAKAIADASQESDFTRNGKSYIYASDGTQIAEVSEDDESSYLEYADIPNNVVDAFIAVEDRTFWENNGIDPKGMVRVLYTYIKSKGKTANGASTITQQLVKLTYLSAEKTLSRKLKEIVIAYEITKKYSKEQIMEYYVNTCCFANGIYGIEDAAHYYFGIDAKELSLSQTAYLCAIPNRPEYYNPKNYPENGLDRRDKILKDMLDCGFIDQSEYDAAVSEQVTDKLIVGSSGSSESGESDTGSSIYNYETTYAINCAVKYFMSMSDDFEFRYSFDSDEDYEEYQNAYSEAYSIAKHALYTGNYKVYTTIDLSMQEKMQDILDEQLSGFTKKTDEGIYKVQGAMTVIDNETGKVIAVIGGRSQEETDGIYTLNRAYQGRFQPGSSIKPLVVYTPALDSGDYTTESLLQNISVDSAKSKSVSEIREMTGTEITLRDAVENSLNGCAYWLFSNVGVSNGISYLHAMEFAKILPEDYNMSTCLGGLSYGVTTEEMANAYSTLENDGVFTDTDCIDRIEDKSGNNVYVQPESVRVYSENAARAMTNVMKGVLTNGTAAKSKWYSYTDTEAAGKTGTTNDCKAGWFCGYTPYYSIAVWVGCDNPTTIDGLYGSSYPLNIWEKAMLALIDGKPAAAFKEPDEGIMEAVQDEDDICTCVLMCTDANVDETCPVCANDFTRCCGGVCTCTEKCYGDAIDETCPVCLINYAFCQGADDDDQCTCSVRCDSENFDPTCRVCSRDIANCTGAVKNSESDSSGTGGGNTGDSGGSSSGGSTGSYSGSGTGSGSNSGGSSSGGSTGSYSGGGTGSGSNTGGSSSGGSTDGGSSEKTDGGDGTNPEAESDKPSTVQSSGDDAIANYP